MWYLNLSLRYLPKDIDICYQLLVPLHSCMFLKHKGDEQSFADYSLGLIFLFPVNKDFEHLIMFLKLFEYMMLSKYVIYHPYLSKKHHIIYLYLHGNDKYWNCLCDFQNLLPFLGPLLRKSSEAYRNLSVIKRLRESENLQVLSISKLMCCGLKWEYFCTKQLFL